MGRARALILLGVLVGGCAGALPSREQFEARLASEFLVDGQTTREQAMLKLGEPSGQFEGQRILTWRLYVDQGGKWGVIERRPAKPGEANTSWHHARFNLVLVFEGQRLAKHSVVAVQ